MQLEGSRKPRLPLPILTINLVIPHNHQRYQTLGDWFFLGRILFVVASKMPNPIYSQAIILHEQTEVLLCREAGVTEEEVDIFDRQFAGEVAHRRHDPKAEAGEDHRAPYHKQHVQATMAERRFLQATGHDWRLYAETVDSVHVNYNPNLLQRFVRYFYRLLTGWDERNNSDLPLLLESQS